MATEPNGNVLRERVEQLRHRLKSTEEAYKFIASMGAKANEQLLVHDQRFRDLDKDLEHMRAVVEDVPVLRERLDTAIDNMKSIRTALYSAAGSLLVVAAAVVFTQ